MSCLRDVNFNKTKGRERPYFLHAASFYNGWKDVTE